jgi:ribosome-associated protein
LNIPRLYASIQAHSSVVFSRSGGPGGQNVNKVNTKVCLHIKIQDIEGLSEAELNRLRKNLAARITGKDEIVVASDKERSQRLNLKRSYSRLENLISAAAQIPAYRHPSKPGRVAQEKRIRHKFLHGLKKRGRKTPLED